MDKEFHNQNILITGAASGLGREIAIEMAKEGANLFLVDINTCETTIGLIEDSQVNIEYTKCNIQNEEDVHTMAQEAGKFFNDKLDVLVNNAGLNGKASLIKDMNLEDWNRTIGVNLTGTMLVCRELLGYLISNGGGSIVNVASNVGKRGLPYRSDYVCSKWALIGLTQTLALEAVDYNIRVNAVCPGPIEGKRIEQLVRMHAVAEGTSYETMYQNWKNVPMKRFIQPQEVCEVIKFLASGRGSSMTGQSLNVTGGMIMS